MASHCLLRRCGRGPRFCVLLLFSFPRLCATPISRSFDTRPSVLSHPLYPPPSYPWKTMAMLVMKYACLPTLCEMYIVKHCAAGNCVSASVFDTESWSVMVLLRTRPPCFEPWLSSPNPKPHKKQEETKSASTQIRTLTLVLAVSDFLCHPLLDHHLAEDGGVRGALIRRRSGFLAVCFLPETGCCLFIRHPLSTLLRREVSNAIRCALIIIIPARDPTGLVVCWLSLYALSCIGYG